MGRQADPAGGMWFEFVGGPSCGQIGWSAGPPPHPVVFGGELQGSYELAEPPQFCLDRDSISAWAGRRSKIAMAAGVHRLFYRSVQRGTEDEPAR